MICLFPVVGLISASVKQLPFSVRVIAVITCLVISVCWYLRVLMDFLSAYDAFAKIKCASNVDMSDCSTILCFRMRSLRKLQFGSRDLCRHVIFHLCSKFRFHRPKWRRDIAKKLFSIWRPSAILNLQSFDFFVKGPSWELRCTSACQIWSKSDDSRLRYGDNAILNMAAVRHLEFEKIAILVTWPISACDLSSLFQISLWSAYMAPRYRQKTIFNMASVRHLESEKLRIFVKKIHDGNWDVHLPTKFDRNRII